MKYQLPTSHWLYFCAQVKKDKIDSNNASGAKNVSSVLNQARMAIDHPISTLKRIGKSCLTTCFSFRQAKSLKLHTHG